MVEMKKVQDPDDFPEMNSQPDGSQEENKSEKHFNQGVKPKIKKQICLSTGKAFQNGSAFPDEKVNGASSSSMPSPSNSSAAGNKVLNDSHDNHILDSSSDKCSAKGRTLSSEDNDLKYDKKRKTGVPIDLDNSSGNEGDEALSGDDCCIYTYKGDQFADLPNSLFSVGGGSHDGNQCQRDNHRKVNRRRQGLPEDNRSNPGSSPEMDYLEMDFDPGPSLEQDSEDEIDIVDCKLFNGNSVPEPSCESVEDTVGNDVNVFANMEACQLSQEPQPGPSNCQIYNNRFNKVSDWSNSEFNRTSNGVENKDKQFCAENRTILGQNPSHNCEMKRVEASNNVCLPVCQHFGGGERLDKKNYTDNKDKHIFIQSESNLDMKIPFDGIMLWTEQEAISKQIPPDVSSGATAVINAMLVLKMQFSAEKVKEAISARLKSESASIPQYLVSRSFAGVAHENLIRGIHNASHGALYARFFQMYPRRDVVLSRWLSHWMKKGAVPIVTMNVQKEASSEDSSLDTRHHQMIFGVNSKGIYLTDPLECLQEKELWCRLSSPSILKIKRQEIMSRWSPGTNLRPLMFQTDERWKKMNVLGQVVNIIRESPDSGAQGKFLTQHISIPASSGITLVIPRNSSGYGKLVTAADLPVLCNSKAE